VAALGSGCATNPVTGRSEFSLVTSNQEQEIGREGYKAVVAEYGIYDDLALQAYVDSVGQRLGRASHLPTLAWRFTVVDDPAVNAFAMPGGYIYITRGILAHLNSEAQLAGVLGHEIGHVTARHTASRITQQQLAGLGFGIASVVSEGFQRYGQVAQTALGLLFLKYGRDDENQADQLGVDYATRAGYDPREIPGTYAMLKRVSERSGQRLPTFLSTHPDPGDREVRTTQLARQAASGKSGLAVRERGYLEHQVGLVFGRDPRQGFFEGERYYHPALRFQITFPAGWQTQDTRSSVVAVESSQRAAMHLTVAEKIRLSPTAYVAELERSGRIAGARGSSETVGEYPAWIGRVTVKGKDEASVVYRAAFIGRPDERLFEILGRSAEPGDADDARILASVQSFGALTDPKRLGRQPDRVRLARVATAGPFATAVQALGEQALDVEGTSILNNLFPDQDVLVGQTLKIVARGARQ
jgi:predicted Zn-dependent protease